MSCAPRPENVRPNRSRCSVEEAPYLLGFVFFLSLSFFFLNRENNYVIDHYYCAGIVFVDGPAWTEQRKFCMQHLRKMGLGGDLMERIICEEVNDLMSEIKRRCAV